MKTANNKQTQSYSPLSKITTIKENTTDSSGNLELLQDQVLSKKLKKIISKPIHEKISRSKVTGAYGTFTVTKDISSLSCAKLFNEVGKQIPLFARFSILSNENNTSDTERDPKEFSLRFFTEDGDWDVTGVNTPVSFTNDITKRNEFLRVQKRDPRTNLKTTTMMWNFFSMNPESLHQAIMLMSDRGTPAGYLNMDGFGVNTYAMTNSKNEKVWVKFHFKNKKGVKALTLEEASETHAADMDHAQRRLINSIDRNNFPKWTLSIQVMTEAQANDLDFNPCDVTKTWTQKIFPLLEVGVIELNKIPESYAKEIEKINFSLTNTVNGINYSPAKEFQKKLKKHVDSNKNQFNEIDQTFTSSLYSDTTFNNNDHYSQPGAFYRKALLEPERASLINNIVASMQAINGPEREPIVYRQLYHWFLVDAKLGIGIAKGLNVNVNTVLTNLK